MKLLTQTTRLQLLSSVLVFLVASAGLFFLLQQAVSEEIDEHLVSRASLVFKQLKEGVQPLDSYLWIDRLSAPVAESLVFSDTLLPDPMGKEEEAFRKLVWVKTLSNEPVRVTVAASRVEWEDFLEVIAAVLGLALLLLLFSSVLLSRFIHQRLWQPFFHNLALLRDFSLREKQAPAFETSRIREFEEMRQVLLGLTQKTLDDYHILKEFTENASHELQTPLAIIQSRIEQLHQDEELGARAHASLEAIQAALSRLSRLNRHLLLLAKIDNRQFDLKETFYGDRVLHEQLTQMEDLFASRNMNLHLDIHPDTKLEGNRILMETLFSNLLSNALHHGSSGGMVEVELNPGFLKVSNPGDPLPFDESRLFQRFSGSTRGTGLGLAICEAICRLHGWKIGYQFYRGRHIFSVSFEKSAAL